MTQLRCLQPPLEGFAPSLPERPSGFRHDAACPREVAADRGRTLGYPRGIVATLAADLAALVVATPIAIAALRLAGTAGAGAATARTLACLVFSAVAVAAGAACLQSFARLACDRRPSFSTCLQASVFAAVPATVFGVTLCGAIALLAIVPAALVAPTWVLRGPAAR